MQSVSCYLIAFHLHSLLYTAHIFSSCFHFRVFFCCHSRISHLWWPCFFGILRSMKYCLYTCNSNNNNNNNSTEWERDWNEEIILSDCCLFRSMGFYRVVWAGSTVRLHEKWASLWLVHFKRIARFKPIRMNARRVAPIITADKQTKSIWIGCKLCLMSHPDWA